ncbi:hypothetical protein CC2G_004190 [Coprinopsis cinerea AmutBmut pab1-1]|nr:hypothetical protein CC2G_004190 [Coprinopsis cinerea AmutBmut pab1-1]
MPVMSAMNQGGIAIDVSTVGMGDYSAAVTVFKTSIGTYRFIESSCDNPLQGPKGFTVFDVTGVHIVNIDYCDCALPPLGIDKRSQLLRSRLFPATLSRPQTAFTFEMLDHYHQLSLQGKVTLYDYYHTIVKRSDLLELTSTPSRSNDFHRTFRLWRLLLMLKRAGRGNIANGVFETKEGDLVIECPACPHPGKNLPNTWREAGPLLFLYTLFLAVDANFKLKGKERGLTDMELMPGWAYFVEESKYQTHLNGYVTEAEINTCQSEHDAVVRAAVRCTPGYNVTGAALVICSRHGLVRRNGAGDLQKGERYCNVDYIIFSAIAAIQLARVVITYDIACQWVKNLHKRLEKLPERLQPNNNTMSLTAAIPSWHINGHGPDCQVNHALIYTPGCGLTCGDEIEGNFSETNVLGASVREMAPGARHESLNDQWHGSNIRKLVKLKGLLAKKFRDAAEMRPQQEESFANLSLTFTPEKIVEWTRMVVAWESDPKNPNPYEEVKLERTMHDVRLQLAKEDEKEVARGVLSAHTTSMTACMVAGLDLEEQQHTLRHDLKSSRLSTSKQKADLQEKRNSMHARITRWREAHIIYSPCILPLLPGLGGDETSDSALKPEDIPLYLPSELTPALRRTIPTFADKERRLREAQADDALADIRLGRRVLTGLTSFKKIHLAGAGNKPNTRVRTLYARVQTKIDKAANRYRRAREALVTLDPNGNWQHRIKLLDVSDIRGPGRDSADESRGRYIPSWIWQVPRVRLEGDKALAEEELDESLRVEWAKARARLHRWNEEYLLVQEEMRRVIVYLAWKAQWWEEHATQEPFKSEDLMHGTLAYAHKQASYCRRLSERFAARWIPLLRKYGEAPMWMPWAGYEGWVGDLEGDAGKKADGGTLTSGQANDDVGMDALGVDFVDEVESDDEGDVLDAEQDVGAEQDTFFEFEIDD